MRINKTITIYNRVMTNEGVVSYHRSVMKCHWEEVVGKAVAGGSSVSTGIRSASAFIPHTEAPKGKAYLDPVMFNQSPNNHFTFAAEDVCFPYIVGSSDVISSAEMTALRRNHKDYFVLTNCSNNDFGSLSMRHWEFACQH